MLRNWNNFISARFMLVYENISSLVNTKNSEFIAAHVELNHTVAKLVLFHA